MATTTKLLRLAIVAASVTTPAALFASPDRVEVPAPAGVSVCAYPSVAALPDQRLLCVFSGLVPPSDGPAAQGAGKLALFATYSSDDGQTWTDPERILNSPDGDDYDSSIIVIGQTVVVSATTTPLGGKTISTSRTMAIKSEDSGRTWSAPYEIPMGRKYTSGKTHNGIVLSDGEALLGFTWEKNLEVGPRPHLTSEGEMEEVNAVLMSFDQGRTWAASQSVELAERRPADATGAINGVCEPALVECSDGSVFMLCRTGLTKLYGSRSHDGGRSWSKPTPTTLTGHNAPAALCRFEGDRPGVLAVWNNSPQHRWPLCVAASTDDCQSWTAPREIAMAEGQESSYPCCTPTRDGKLLVVYQQAREGGRDILGVRFDPNWLFESPSNSSAKRGASQATLTAHRSPITDDARNASPPTQVAHFPAMPKPAILSDGTWAAYFIEHEGPGLAPTPAEQRVYARYSQDRGRTWGEAETLFDLPPEAGGFGYHMVMVDQDGEVHLFILCDDGTGVVRLRTAASGQTPVEPLDRQRLDIWHVKSSDGRTAWTLPHCIWEGRAGDLLSVTQLDNGRIVFPVSYLVDRSWAKRGEGPASFTYTGQFDTTVLTSDDLGASWQKSPSVLRTATPDLSSYGAVEPAVLQLTDGRVWMLLRTQLGRFYESFSLDGATWSDPKPSRIKSSDSPAALSRLADGRILLIRNNCQRHPYAQGSRHVLHASISDDDGKTWSGAREIVRDPYRDEPPPPDGDHGVSYPFVAVGQPSGEEDSVAFALWVETGKGRSLWKLDPDWLTEQRAADDFSQGLDHWSTFGTRGVAIAAHPSRDGDQVMSLEARDANWPTAAVWNFPVGSKGRLRARLLLDANAPQASIQLTDHFSPPYDEQSGLYSLFNIDFTNSRARVDAARVKSGPWSADQWHDVELDWDCGEGTCCLRVDGVAYQSTSQQHASDGPSYLRLSVHDETGAATGRVLVEHVDVDVSPDHTAPSG